jgi:hypothetical protein
VDAVTEDVVRAAGANEDTLKLEKLPVLQFTLVTSKSINAA